MNPQRIFTYSIKEKKNGKSVIYWMSRDQRVYDNHALLAAATFAKERSAELMVVFCLDTSYPGANRRSFQFMLEGLEEVSRSLSFLNISFSLLLENPVKALPSFVEKEDALALFSDFDPLRIKQQWKEELQSLLSCSHFEVDTHNVVPCRIASQKEEFGAYTFRPRFERQLPHFINDLPDFEWQKQWLASVNSELTNGISFSAKDIINKISFSVEIAPVDLPSGEIAARNACQEFLSERLTGYNSERNFPEKNHTSRLSAYLHFGQISAHRIALQVMKSTVDEVERAAFIEQLLVRRELSDNFCFYQKQYDSLQGIAPWAMVTLYAHERDERSFLYTEEQFENARTHERLWNAAQRQLLQTGLIHGYMRMYWAKKILEWSESPAEALRIAIGLNDKYALDGRDPNGYVGCQWAIAGVHDRAWAERPVYGKIRYMNENGCRRKFDVEKYICAVDGNISTLF